MRSVFACLSMAMLAGCAMTPEGHYNSTYNTPASLAAAPLTGQEVEVCFKAVQPALGVSCNPALLKFFIVRQQDQEKFVDRDGVVVRYADINYLTIPTPDDEVRKMRLQQMLSVPPLVACELVGGRCVVH